MGKFKRTGTRKCDFAINVRYLSHYLEDLYSDASAKRDGFETIQVMING